MKKALHRHVKDRLPPRHPLRVIGDIGEENEGPVAVFFGGIHGNEPAGVAALEQMMAELAEKESELQGRVIAIRGNIKALLSKRRYLDEDLNRLWTKEAVMRIKIKPVLLEEEREMLEILGLLEEILDSSAGPFYFFDLHTTSGKSHPFITINDALTNRKFAARIPVPIILGIEEHLTGPLLSYVNQLGYVALGFEGGQHEDPCSVDRCKAFCYLSLQLASIFGKEALEESNVHIKQLKTPAFEGGSFFEIVNVFTIGEFEAFKMQPGFESFQPVSKGTPIAFHQGHQVLFPQDAHIFMPLYQSQGGEGFFVIRKIPTFFLGLSTALRKFKLDSLLVLLPGVSWESKKKEILRVDRRIAKYLAKQLFHLLGYRLRVIDGRYLRLYSRERASKKQSYAHAAWW